MQWKTGINQNSQKENNLSLVIRAIHGDDQSSRVKLCDVTGLKQATISKIVNQLIDWDMVQETESLESNLGRKPIGLTLNSEKYLLIAVRINRDYLHVAIYDISNKMHYYREARIDAGYGVTASMALLKLMIHEAISSVHLKVMGIGVALPGPFDYKHQRITLMSGFPGWDKINIKSELEGEFGLPVFMDHDAKCGALAELWYGKYRMNNHLLYICCDRGVGAGFILDKLIYHGQTGFAGEIGHTSINIFGPICECGNHGCLELYCSTNALEQEYRREAFSLTDNPNAQVDQVSARDILQKVLHGDQLAKRVYERVVGYLAFGAVNVVNTLNPEVVIFADKMIEGGDLFIETARKVLKNYLLPEVYANLTIDISTLDGDPMLLGASVLVFEELLTQPSQYFGNGQDIVID
jgi:N-acetylglucosamine repressor